MPPDTPAPGSPKDWLRHARGDLALAQVETSPQLLELLCFHAQQACEKALKGALVHFGTMVPKTHNLRTLVDLLMPLCAVPPEVAACVELTDFAVTTRYPGIYEPVTVEEHQEAILTAEHTVQWIEEVLNRPALP